MNKVQIATSRLVAILLVPGIVLAQNTDTNQSKSEIEPEDDAVGSTGNVGLTQYEKFMLENTPSLQNVSKEQKDNYLQKFKEFRTSLSGYEANIMDKLEDLAIAESELKDAKESNKDEKTIQKYESLKALRIFELEDLGVPTTDRLNANPDYWMKKAIAAKNFVENNDTQKISGEYNDSTITYVHATNSALTRTSIIWVPCWNNNFQVSCPNLNWGWNTGSTTTAFWFIPTDGAMSFGSQICNDKNIGHDKIHYSVRIERDITSIFGTSLYDYDRTTIESLDADSVQCDDTTIHKSVNAGSRADLTTSLSNISVTG